MPFVTAVRFYPGINQGGELQKHAEAQTKAQQSAGLDAQLSVTRWGPDAPYYLLAYRYNSLADYEANPPRAQKGFKEFNDTIAPLMRQTTVTFVNERLQTANPGGTVKWQQANVLAPALGKAAELRLLLLEDGKRLEVEGRRLSLLVQVAGPEPGIFSRIFQYDSLASFEESRARIGATEAGIEFQRTRDALLSRPVSGAIREVLVPYAS